MPLRKIADLPQPCRNPDHDPPTMIVLEPGVYEHTCPGCGNKVVFTVTKAMMDVRSGLCPKPGEPYLHVTANGEMKLRRPNPDAPPPESYVFGGRAKG